MSEPGGDAFDMERLRGLVELMIEHDLNEIDLNREGQRIRLRRGGLPQRAAAPPPPPAAPAPPASSPAVEEDPNIVYVKSPMVGTFYAKPNPEAQPYLKVGDHVDPETTVCIIEAMKTFNEIPAEVRGEVVAILADDGEPVEFGMPLFKVDTSR